MALTAIGLADQMPRFASAATLEPVKAIVESERRFVESLEASLPEGAMLFLLPVMETPEGHAVLKVTDYEHYRLYLFSSRLRLSYGADKGRPREDWQHRLIDADPRPWFPRSSASGSRASS